jgi:hypothetical protein
VNCSFSSEQSPADVKPVNKNWEDEKGSVSEKSVNEISEDEDEDEPCCGKSECKNDSDSPSFGVENSGGGSTVSSQSNSFSSSPPPQFVPVAIYPSCPSFPCSPPFFPSPSVSSVYFSSSSDLNAVFPSVLFSSSSSPDFYQQTLFVNPNEYKRRLCKNIECFPSFCCFVI